MRSKVLFFPMLKLELIETYHVKLSTVQGQKSIFFESNDFIGLSSSFPNYKILYRYDSIVYKMHFIYIDCIEKWVREEGRMFAKE